MGAVGLEPTETGVEGFTVVRSTKIHHYPQSLQQKYQCFMERTLVVENANYCDKMQAIIPLSSHGIFSLPWGSEKGHSPHKDHSKAHNIAMLRLNVYLNEFLVEDCSARTHDTTVADCGKSPLVVK